MPIAAGPAPHPVQLEWVCGENREAVLELTADGHVIAMTPTGSETGARNSRLELRLLLWADQQGGWRVRGTSSGFRLPAGSVLRPDASMIRLYRWQALSPALVVNWRAPATKVQGAYLHCARRWPPTRQMVPGWAGCCCSWLRSGRGELTGPILKPIGSAAPAP